MKLMIDVPEEIYEECKMQAELIGQEGTLIESTNLLLKILVANGKALDQEPKTGHWIDGEIQADNSVLPVQICDKCNTFYPLAYTGGGHKYCPNCGTKMESEVE